MGLWGGTVVLYFTVLACPCPAGGVELEVEPEQVCVRAYYRDPSTESDLRVGSATVHGV